MRVFKNELFKVISKPMFILIFILFLAANVVLISTSSSSDYYSNDAYKQVYIGMKDMSSDEKASYIEDRYNTLSILNEIYTENTIQQDLSEKWNLSEQEAAKYYEMYSKGECLDYTGDLFSEYYLFSDLYKEIEQIKNYPNYLDSIMQKADNSQSISIFNVQDEYSQRNAQKTADAFEPLLGNELEYTNSKMLNTAMNFNATDVMLVLLLFVITTILITYENEKQLFILLKPTKKGRASLIISKIAVLFILSVIITTMLYASSFIAAGVQYGFADLSVNVQSIYGFDGCSFNITVWQYLIIYSISKIAIGFLIGLILFFFALTSKSSIMIYVKTIAIFVLSLGFNLLIPGNSVIQIFKYANLIYFLRVTPIYQYYFNLSMFNYPINMFSIFIIVMAAAIIIFVAVNIYLFARKDTVVATGGKLKKFKRRSGKAHTSIVYHEIHKMFIANKVIIILIILAAFQVYNLSQQSTYVDIDEYYYKLYMSVLEGPLNDDKLDIIENEQQCFDELDQLMIEAEEKYSANKISENEYMQTQNYVQEQTKSRNGFYMVLERLDYINQYNKNTDGNEAWFVYDTGWNQLTAKDYQGYEDDIVQAIILSLCMIACFATVFSTEFSSRMIYIITCYKNGRMKTVQIKALISLVAMTIIYFMSYIIQFISVLRQYGLSYADAYICSIPSLADFPVNIKIWQYILLVYLVRYISAVVVLCLIFMVSVLAKNTMQSILILSVVLIIPLALNMLGIDIINYFSLNAFLSGNMFLDTIQNNPACTLLFLIPVTIGIFSMAKIRKGFKEK